SSCSHRGRVRKINEDACLDQSERGMWAVADGMGGHACGELASRLVVESLLEIPPAHSLSSFFNDARNQLRSANRQLRIETLNRDLPIIGSTVAVLLACDHNCAYLWAGDSRIYLWRDGRLRLLTRDHSYVEEVRSRRDPNAEDTLHRLPSNLITRAVGIADTLDLEEGAIEVIDGDVFLLCTDGLSNAVHHLEIGNALLPGSCRQASEALLAMALTRGGHDNISAVVVRAEDLQSSDRTETNPAL
ncbi:MAG: PP2C family protein-serine/threonine phosphatase, partial [Burkholderiales bacterium]